MNARITITGYHYVYIEFLVDSYIKDAGIGRRIAGVFGGGHPAMVALQAMVDERKASGEPDKRFTFSEVVAPFLACDLTINSAAWAQFQRLVIGRKWRSDNTDHIMAMLDIPQRVRKERILSNLLKHNMLTDEHIEWIANFEKSFEAESAAKALALFGEHSLPDYFLEPIKASTVPFNLVQALIILKENSLLQNALVTNACYTSSQPENIAKAVVELQAHDLADNEDMVRYCCNFQYPHVLAEAFSEFSGESSVLSNDQIFTVIQRDSRNGLSDLRSLKKVGFLTKLSYQLLTLNRGLCRVADVLVLLSGKRGLIDQFKRELFYDRSDPYPLALALDRLDSAGLMCQPYLAWVLERRKAPDQLAQAFWVLEDAHLLTSDYCVDLILRAEEAHTCAQLLVQLQSMNPEFVTPSYLHGAHVKSLVALSAALTDTAFWTEDTVDCLLNCSPDHLAHIVSTIELLARSQWLTSELLEHVIAIPKAEALPALISQLMHWDAYNRVKLVTVENLVRLFDGRHQWLYTNEAKQQLWDRLAYRHLTQENFDEILRLAEREDPVALVGPFVNWLLHRGEEGQPQNPLNDQQSTHHASVHKSVSTSAKKILEAYGEIADLEQRLNDVKECLGEFTGDDRKKAVAEECFERITAPEFTFVDAGEHGSGLSIQQLLAYWGCVVRDYARAEQEGSIDPLVPGVSRQDAIDALVEALFEIERGYALDDNHEDTQPESPSSPVCTSGTFNKLIEKLVGIHPDVEVQFVTHSVARTAFPKLVTTSLIAFLNQCSARAQAQWLAKLREEPDEVAYTNALTGELWQSIQEKVEEKVLDEFGLAYNSDKQHPKFIELIAMYAFVDLSEVTEAFDKPPVTDLFRPASSDSDEGAAESKLNDPGVTPPA